jgi:hypothetical protein
VHCKLLGEKKFHAYHTQAITRIIIPTLFSIAHAGYSRKNIQFFKKKKIIYIIKINLDAVPLLGEIFEVTVERVLTCF